MTRSLALLLAASMTKQFTGASIGLLALDRKLALTDDVRMLHLEQGDFTGRRAVVPTTATEFVSKLPGIYCSPELDSELRIEHLGGRVIVDAGHNRKFPIGQIGESRFVIPGGATIEFIRGTDGQVSGLEYSSSRVRKLSFARRAE